jgi:hypothetical protein
MEWAALITWILTAGGGFVMLAIWLGNGGMEQGRNSTTGGNPLIRPPLILGHFALAATGLVLWIIYVASDSDALAWIAFVMLLIVAALGFTMFAIWLRQRNAAPAPAAAPADAPADAPAPATHGGGAEQRFPVAIVGAHGVLAATTLVLVFLAAVGVGS